MGAEASHEAELKSLIARTEMLMPPYFKLQIEKRRLLKLEETPSPATLERVHAIDTQLREFRRQTRLIEEKLHEIEPTPPDDEEHSYLMKVGLLNVWILNP